MWGPVLYPLNLLCPSKLANAMCFFLSTERESERHEASFAAADDSNLFNERQVIAASDARPLRNAAQQDQTTPGRQPEAQSKLRDERARSRQSRSRTRVGEKQTGNCKQGKQTNKSEGERQKFD